MLERVFRGGRGVATDPEVRVRVLSIVMAVVGLWGEGRAGDRAEREARGDECGPVVQ